MKKSLAILGSTGSVGRSTLEVVARHPDRFDVVALSAFNNVALMYQQCLRFQPEFVAMLGSQAAAELNKKLNETGLQIEVGEGMDGLLQVATSAESNCVMAAIVGAAGLLPTFAAVRQGKQVLVANKEPLVMTGDLFMREAAASGAVIIPIDSEHNALYQSLPNGKVTAEVHKLHLTASGGPFLGKNWQSLKQVTPAQACKHPNWTMGSKISVDSATMMNKGLELIEACALFGVRPEQVEIIIHPQSVIHSLVEYIDGSFLAQLGTADMRIPIAHALAWPQRLDSGAQSLNLIEIAKLDFQQPNLDNTPCLRLARAAAETGGAAPIVLNAANETAVQGFLDEKIRFTEIAELIDTALQRHYSSPDDLDSVLNIDNEVRQRCFNSLN